MASDTADAQVGPMLAREHDIPHATMVTRIEVQEGGLKVWRELEGGWEETFRIPLPCLLAIQSGINEPRYVSITGIRKVRGRTIDELGKADLNLSPDEVGKNGSLSYLLNLSFPPEGEGGEILGGSSEAIAERVYRILKEKGGVA